MTRGRGGLSELEKPEKIYLNNPSLIHAIAIGANTGTLRETYFINMLQGLHKVSLPEKGDFLVDDAYTFEVGGKSKGFTQLKGVKEAFLAADDIETGSGNRLPLWLFGFLY